MSKNNSKAPETKKDKTRIIIIFVIILIASGIVGGFVNVIASIAGYGFDKVDKAAVLMAVYWPVQYFSAAVTIIWSTAAIIGIAYIKKLIKAWDGEDEDLIDEIEERLNFPIVASSLAQVFGMMMFGVTAYLDKVVGVPGFTYFAITMAVFFVNMAMVLTVQNISINLEKKLNPEKRGMVFDFQFNKKWTDSSDEAEKQIMAKGGLTAYYAGSYTCMFFWILSIIGMFSFHTGIYPVIMACAIWAVMTIAYSVKVMKLSKRKK